MEFEDCFIFTGPTLLLQEAQAVLDANYLPPVKQGDIYRIVELYTPRCIGIIDGYFNQVPAVWHKEILWAMEQGVTVYGAASMGALRAAELDLFGMIGYGKIYEAYSAGVLPPFVDEVFEDDDEVAVIHGPAQLAYPSMSDAMVNIRFTLAQALKDKVIDRACLNELTRIAKSLFYPERTHKKIIELAQQTLEANSLLIAYEKWLEEHAVDQKKLDALGMLNQIARDLSTTDKSVKSTFTLQQTSQWQQAITQVVGGSAKPNAVVNELRLEGSVYFQTLDKAVEAAVGFSQSHAINAESLTELHQNPVELESRLSAQLNMLECNLAVDQWPNTLVESVILNYLRAAGQYQQLEVRSTEKQSILDKVANKPDIGAFGDIDLLQLGDWYFSHCLEAEMPHDISNYAISCGFDDVTQFYTIIFDEYLYLEERAQDAEPNS